MASAHSTAQVRARLISSMNSETESAVGPRRNPGRGYPPRSDCGHIAGAHPATRPSTEARSSARRERKDMMTPLPASTKGSRERFGEFYPFPRDLNGLRPRHQD